MNGGAEVATAKESRMGELMTQAQIELNALEEIKDVIYSLQIYLLGDEPPDSALEDGEIEPSALMDILMLNSKQKRSLIENIDMRVRTISQALRL